MAYRCIVDHAQQLASLGANIGNAPEPFEEGAYIRVDFDIVLCPEPRAKVVVEAQHILKLTHPQASEMLKAAQERRPWTCGSYPGSEASSMLSALQQLGLKAYMTDVRVGEEPKPKPEPSPAPSIWDRLRDDE